MPKGGLRLRAELSKVGAWPKRDKVMRGLFAEPRYAG